MLRYLIATLAAQRFGPEFPVGTFVINIAGSFALGIVAELALSRAGMTTELRTFLAVGVLGGFTTFSSFALETLDLIREGSLVLATGYAVGSVVLGVLAALLGIAAVRVAGA